MNLQETWENKKIVHDLGLLSTFELDKITDTTCMANCNGIGPEAFPVFLRTIITNWLDIYSPAAFLHDLEYSIAPEKSLNHFRKCNDLFRINCLRLNSVSGNSITRFWGRQRIKALYLAVESFGWESYWGD
jgi:hypothetical protein